VDDGDDESKATDGCGGWGGNDDRHEGDVEDEGQRGRGEGGSGMSDCDEDGGDEDDEVRGGDDEDDESEATDEGGSGGCDDDGEGEGRAKLSSLVGTSRATFWPERQPRLSGVKQASGSESSLLIFTLLESKMAWMN
jgi:hypothetical protein